MTEPGPLVWRTLVNHALAALAEQEQYLAEREQGENGGGHRASPLDWEEARCRYRQALVQLSRLAEQSQVPPSYQDRRVVSGLELRGRHLKEQWEELGRQYEDTA